MTRALSRRTEPSRSSVQRRPTRHDVDGNPSSVFIALTNSLSQIKTNFRVEVIFFISNISSDLVVFF